MPEMVKLWASYSEIEFSSLSPTLNFSHLEVYLSDLKFFKFELEVENPFQKSLDQILSHSSSFTSAHQTCKLEVELKLFVGNGMKS